MNSSDELKRGHRRLQCENALFSVYFDRVEDLRSGEWVENYLSVEFKRKNQGVYTGVAVLPILNRQAVLLRVFRPAIGLESWEAPKGFVEEGETMEASAVRELEEEIGSAPQSLILVGECAIDSALSDARSHLYLAPLAYLAQGWTSHELGHRERKGFDRVALRRMENQGAILDVQTQLLIARAIERDLL